MIITNLPYINHKKTNYSVVYTCLCSEWIVCFNPCMSFWNLTLFFSILSFWVFVIFTCLSTFVLQHIHLVELTLFFCMFFHCSRYPGCYLYPPNIYFSLYLKHCNFMQLFLYSPVFLYLCIFTCILNFPWYPNLSFVSWYTLSFYILSQFLSLWLDRAKEKNI